MTANVIPISRQAAALKAEAVRERQREAERKTKIDRAAGVLDRLEARTAVLDAQIKALQARRRIVCARTARFEERTLELMRRFQFSQLQGVTRLLIARPAPLSLIVDDDAKIPSEYLRVKYEPMKVEIKNALGRGEEIDGVRLVQNVTLVRR